MARRRSHWRLMAQPRSYKWGLDLRATARGPWNRHGDIFAMEVLVGSRSYPWFSFGRGTPAWRLVALPHIHVGVLACADDVVSVGSARRRHLATRVSEPWSWQSRKIIAWIIGFFLERYQGVPRNFWVSWIPSKSRIWESADVINTSDGVPGTNCKRLKIIVSLYYDRNLCGRCNMK